MFYTVYKITNQINGKFYVGAHKTEDLNDDYMGSGKKLINAQQKYGIENFKKEILYIFDNSDDMYVKEAEIVTEEFVSDKNTYNIVTGGKGGWEHVNSTKKNLYGKNGQPGYGRENLIPGLWKSDNISEEYKLEIRNKISRSLKEGYSTGKIKNPFKGKTHTEKTKKLLSEKSSKNQKGKKNSQYGTCWVWCEKEGNKKIKKEKLDDYIKSGWEKKRVLYNHHK